MLNAIHRETEPVTYQSTGLIIKTRQKKKKSPVMWSLVKKGSFLTCCANSTMIALARSSNSSLVFFFCFFRVAATSESGLFFQSYNLSILLRATMKGHFLDFKRLIDSIVWGSKPCIISTTKMAMSQRELPLFLRLLLEKDT